MEMGLLVVLGAVAATHFVLLCVLLGAALSGRRRMRLALAASRADVEALRARLDEIEFSGAAATPPPVAPQTDYLITTAERARATGHDPTRVPDRVVLSATLGEPLVKVVAFGYGVRRALSPRTRNRIAFEMRREVRRARKQRRRDARRDTRRGTGRDTGRETGRGDRRAVAEDARQDAAA